MPSRTNPRPTSLEETQTGFSEALETLAGEGSTVLVVGDVDPAGSATATKRLLGDHSPYRTQVLALLDHPPAEAERFVAGTVDPTGERFGLVVPGDAARLTRSASVTAVPPRESASARRIEPTPAGLAAAIRTEVEARHPPTTEWPTDLRIGVVSLRPLLDWTGVDDVVEMVRGVGKTVREHGGVAHFHLPVAPDDPRADRLVSSEAFDVVVELRDSTDGVEERWTVTTAGARSDWLVR
jgi:hypothetical protein